MGLNRKDLNGLFEALLGWSFPESANPSDGLTLWRIRVLFTICLLAAALGLLALIPSVLLALHEGRPAVAIIDIFLYLWLLGLILARRLSLQVRAWATSAALFILGLALVITLGPFGAGYVWIFAFGVFCGLILGMRAALVALGINVLAVLLVAWLIWAGHLPWARDVENPLGKWLITAASFLLLNALIAVSTALMLRGLKVTLDEKQQANEKLLAEIDVRQRAEVALRRSQELFRDLIEHSAVPSVVFGLDGGVELTNPAFTRTFGWTVNDPDLPDALRHLGSDTGHDGGGERPDSRGERKILCRDGTVREVVVQADTLTNGRSHAQIIDMTERNHAERERRKLEEQLRQSQKMEAIGTLAGGVAHDFNNLLTVILGEAQLLLGEMAPNHPYHGDLQEVEKAALKAAALTRQLLAFSRKQVAQPILLNMSEVVAEIRKMLLRLIGEDIELNVQLAPDLGLVRADPAEMDQVIVNLAANARDAMPTGGRLTITTANVELTSGYFSDHGDEALPGPYTLLTVGDTGQGMDRETMSHIFEPFFTTKERGKGTGLGLAMVYGIVKQAGGLVWVYSEPGLGTTFKIYLPCARDNEGEAEKETRRPADFVGSETVLVVEDDSGVRKLVESTLRRHGYTVLSAAAGHEALQLARDHPGTIHLLLTDVIMPKMSGQETGTIFKRLRPRARVIFMSGYIDDAVLRHGIIEHGTPYLEKPFAPESLVNMVRKVLDGEEGAVPVNGLGRHRLSES